MFVAPVDDLFFQSVKFASASKVTDGNREIRRGFDFGHEGAVAALKHMGGPFISRSSSGYELQLTMYEINQKSPSCRIPDRSIPHIR